MVFMIEPNILLKREIYVFCIGEGFGFSSKLFQLWIMFLSITMLDKTSLYFLPKRRHHPKIAKVRDANDITMLPDLTINRNENVLSLVNSFFLY